MTAAFRMAYVDTPTGQIHYRYAGDENGIPLLLIHQSGTSGAMWDPVIPVFASKGYRVYALDLPGHGNSVRGIVAPSIEDYGNAAWEFVEALKLPPLALVGHHSGATLAVWMAANRPDHVPAIALWGAPVLTPEKTITLSNEKPRDWENAQDWLSAAWASRKDYSGPGWHVGINIRNFKDLLSTAPHNHEYHNAIARTPIRDILRTLQQPVLALAGDMDLLRDGSVEAAEIAPKGRYVDIENGGGDVVDHHTDRFVQEVDSFLTEVGAKQ